MSTTTCSIAKSVSNSWAWQIAVHLCAGVNSMPVPWCSSLFAQKALLNLVSLSPNPSNAVPVDVHCFFMADIDECVDKCIVDKGKRLDGSRLWPQEMGERLHWAEDCQTGASWGGVCFCGQAFEPPFIELMTWLTHGIGSSPSSSSSLWQRPVSSLVLPPLGLLKSPAGKLLPFSSYVIGQPGWYTFRHLGFVGRKFWIAW